MPSAVATSTTVSAIPPSVSSSMRSHAQLVTLRSSLRRTSAARLLDAATLRPLQFQLPLAILQALTQPLHTLSQPLILSPPHHQRSVLTRTVRSVSTVSAGTIQLLHAWSSLATVLTISVPPSVNATTRSHSVVLTSSLRPTRSTSVALLTHAAMSHARTLSAQRLSQHATTVRILLLFSMTSAAAHTSASVTDQAVLSSAIAHAQPVMSVLSLILQLAVQLPSASHATQQLVQLPPRPHQLSTSTQLPQLVIQSIPLQLHHTSPRHSHHMSATQSALTTRVRPSTMATAGHQRSVHTASATLTVMSSARRPSVPQ